MPAERVTMRKIKDILRLKWACVGEKGTGYFSNGLKDCSKVAIPFLFWTLLIRFNSFCLAWSLSPRQDALPF